MKLSADTYKILKNFATIDRGILIKPGNVLRTRTEAIYAEATVEEQFPLEVGIHDLSNLLNAVDLFTEPELVFEDSYLRIAENSSNAQRSQVIYGYAGEDLITLPMRKKSIEIPNENIAFSLSEEDLFKIKRAVAVFQKPELKITSDGNTVSLSTEDHTQQQGHSYSLEVEADTKGLSCSMVFNFNNLLLLKGDYLVKVTPLFTQFQHRTLQLSYLVGPEPNYSTFNAGA